MSETKDFAAVVKKMVAANKQAAIEREQERQAKCEEHTAKAKQLMGPCLTAIQQCIDARMLRGEASAEIGVQLVGIHPEPELHPQPFFRVGPSTKIALDLSFKTNNIFLQENGHGTCCGNVDKILPLLLDQLAKAAR